MSISVKETKECAPNVELAARWCAMLPCRMGAATISNEQVYDRPRLPPRNREEIFDVVRSDKARRVIIAMPTGMYEEAKTQARLRGVSVYSIFQRIGADRLIDRIDEKRGGVQDNAWKRYSLYLPKDAKDPSPVSRRRA